MGLRTLTPLVVLALALALTQAPLVSGAASYSLSISPSVPVSLGSSMTFTLTLSGGNRNSAYTVLFDVVKPNGIGSAFATRVITTNNSGAGSVSLNYPDPSFSPSSGTAATDVDGVYGVYVNQTSPTNIGQVQSGQFTVSSKLTVVLSQPVGGTIVQKLQTVNISATVSALSGPDNGAIVYANTPANGQILLLQTSPGVYSYNYQISSSDPTGVWILMVQASDSVGNSGNSTPVNVTIAKNDLIVDSLLTYNSTVPSTSFSSGDTIYAFFKIRYSSGSYLTTGQYQIRLENPSGTTVANLTAAYDGSLFGFYASTGYSISSLEEAGTWRVVIEANSINDGYGNTGPNITVDYAIQVTIDNSPPSWPTGSALTISSLTPSSLLLSWTAATSNTGIASYRVLENGTLLATVSGNTTSYRLTGLTPGVSYRFTVEAVDATGNVSSTKLSQTETMPPPQQSFSYLWFIIAAGVAGAFVCAGVALAMVRERCRR